MFSRNFARLLVGYQQAGTTVHARASSSSSSSGADGHGEHLYADVLARECVPENYQTIRDAISVLEFDIDQRLRSLSSAVISRPPFIFRVKNPRKLTPAEATLRIKLLHLQVQTRSLMNGVTGARSSTVGEPDITTDEAEEQTALLKKELLEISPKSQLDESKPASVPAAPSMRK